ncbi:hypothetical protein O3628_07415 [Streptococcus anginosus]|uniref:hypothetical protein n=1 Tax=Streptococcus anginosus group TaxID=671232 RepID=UPI000D0939D3|nr:hypothetical protein [Streptococcus anginosus]HEO8696417.1 hypothetical protein [Streptococcus agalactiae]HES0703435.1 hypothetical protein [Streptococcus pyogenes]MCW1059304.1 hypothetical protein [Streptococcus anginosus]MDB8655385.1 hypothetical protein [Streptococcus anginosus]MDB8658894.1 hypothetical protein [Streptococcus anginosus]
MSEIKQQIDELIIELTHANSSIGELAKRQYCLLKQTNATSTDFNDFLDDLKIAVAPFKNR